MEKILVFIFLLSAFVPHALAQGGSPDLKELQEKAKQKEEELKKYLEQEKKIAKEIAELERKTARADRQKNAIETDISVLEQNLLSTESKREALERSFPMWEKGLVNELALYYTDKQTQSPFYNSDDVLQDLFVQSVLPQKADFVTRIHKENQNAKKQILGYEEKNKALLQQTSKIDRERNLLTKDFTKRKLDLTDTHKKYEAAKKELDELNKSAEEIMKLLADAENKRKKEEAAQAKKQGAPAPSRETVSATIDANRNSFPWPVDGKIISAFGKEYRDDLKTWIFRDGVKISARRGEQVYSIAEGTVIYAGSFRSYGNVVILDHGKGFFTISGFLSEIFVDKGDSVGQRTPLGIVGTDTQQGSMGTGKTALYFEIRKGTTPEDPAMWLISR